MRNTKTIAEDPARRWWRDSRPNFRLPESRPQSWKCLLGKVAGANKLQLYSSSEMPAGGGNSGGGGSASGGGDSRHRAHFGRGHRSGGRSFGGGRGGRRDRARGRDSDSSTLSSSSISSSDHGPVTVATDSSQAAPSLVDVASSAESLSCLLYTSPSPRD